MIKQFIKRIIIINVIFALMLMIYRIIFAFYYSNLSEFSQYVEDLIQAFILGTRYDCTVLAYMNLPIILFFIVLLFIGKQKLFTMFIKNLKYYYTIFFGLIVILLCIDFIFCFYFGYHVNYLMFEIFESKLSYLWYISKNEHLMFSIILIIILFVILFVFFISKFILEKNIKNFSNSSLSNKILTCCIVILFSLFFIFQCKYNIDNRFEDTIFEKLTIHPIFEMYDSLFEFMKVKNNNFDVSKYFGYKNNVLDAFADYLDIDKNIIQKENPKLSLLKTTKYNREIEKNNPNIILIVAESLGMDLMQYNNKEFDLLGELKKHFDEDIVFYNCLFSYENTNYSLGHIFTSMLRMPKYALHFNLSFEAFFSYCNAIDQYREKGYVLEGITTSDNFMKIDNLETDFKCDEEIFEKIFKILDKTDIPVFIYALTVTNHHPYFQESLKNYKFSNKIINETVPNDILAKTGLQTTYYYSCQQLGLFLTKLKKSKYADNTIVAIIGDHCTRGLDDYSNYLTLRSVPFYLYIPERLKPKKELIDTSRIVSHIDVMPTLIELSLSNTKYYSLGRSVFDKNYQNAISSNYYDAIIANRDDMCFYDFDTNEIKSYKLTREKNKLAKYKETEPTENHKKMIKQYKAAMVISQYMLEEANNNDK